MRVMNHNWSATKQRLHPQSVAEISRIQFCQGTVIDNVRHRLGRATRTQISVRITTSQSIWLKGGHRNDASSRPPNLSSTSCDHFISPLTTCANWHQNHFICFQNTVFTSLVTDKRTDGTDGRTNETLTNVTDGRADRQTYVSGGDSQTWRMDGETDRLMSLVERDVYNFSGSFVTYQSSAYAITCWFMA